MPSYRELLSSYIPLMIQACSQSLTYPLVAMVVVRGHLGAAAMAAFAQGQVVMMLLGSLSAGVITAGMIYARDRRGYENFFRLNVYLGAVVAVLQIICAVPLGHYIFEHLLNMEGELLHEARYTLLLGIPANFAFALRTPYQVVLYNAMASGRANAASLGRIVFTLICSALWCYFFPTGGGILPATVVFTVPIYLEILISRQLCLRYWRALPEVADAVPVKTQFWFALPLGIGGAILLLSPLMNATFIGRSADPQRMQTIHFLVMGIVNPLSYSALRMQPVLLQFTSNYGPAVMKKVRRFAMFIGGGLGVFVASLALIPAATAWYFGVVQKLPAADVKLAAFATLCLLPYPFLQSLRSYTEGAAAWQRNTRLIMLGQIMFLVSLIVALIGLRQLNSPGYLMGVIALNAASLVTFATVHYGLIINKLIIVRRHKTF